MPADTQTNDAWHWHINLEVPDTGDGAAAIRRAGYTEVSNGVTPVDRTAVGYASGFMIRDPDGHASLLSQR